MQLKMSVNEIKNLVASSDISSYPSLAESLYTDNRKQVKTIACSLMKKYDKYVLEQKRIDRLKLVENDFYAKGIKLIAGIDEAGRGPLCGPVVSAAVIMPQQSRIPKINDSKKLSSESRDKLYESITESAVAWAVGIVDNKTIDEINILNAAKLSMKIAVESLKIKPQLLLIDALKIESNISQISYIKGDENIYSISAASIIAKVTRDRMMKRYALKYPEYCLDANKGYGTYEHIEAIKKYGPSPLHRKSFLSSIYTSHAQNYNIGMQAEEFAVKYIIGLGKQVIERNYKRAGGEIDIIYKDGDILVFCEVKARSRADYGRAEEFVNYDKKEKLILTAKKYMFEKCWFGSSRFDIIGVDMSGGDKKIHLYENAFNIN